MTNTSLTSLAEFIKGLNCGFAGLVIRKKGKIKMVGRGKNRKRYGDDLVHVVVVSGFSYLRLAQRTLDKLLSGDIGAQDIKDLCDKRGLTDKNGNPITLADCCKAIDDQIGSLQRTLDPNQPSTSTTAHVYEPLVVDGEVQKGFRVYCGAGDPSDPKAPIPGAIYVQGLKIGQKVIEPAPNGPIPPSKSRGDVIAKRVLRGMLPIGRYVSYALEPGGDYIFKAGGKAASAADKAGVAVDQTAVSDAKVLAQTNG